jgi:aminoglycoside phosphotransferase (APT) family kinase protein
VGPFRAILDGAPRSWAARRDVLAHGDLYARHLLVDLEGQLAGVIDWGDVHIGDPAVDLSIAHSFLPPSAHPGFLDAYGAVAAPAWSVARLRALWHTSMVLLYAADCGDADLLREGLRAMSCIRDGWQARTAGA